MAGNVADPRKRNGDVVNARSGLWLRSGFMQMLSGRRARLLVNQGLGRFDLTLQRRSRMEELGFIDDPTSGNVAVPPGADEYLRRDHPRLVELAEAYSGHPASGHTQWTDEFVATDIDLMAFRGDNAYVSQRLGTTEASYAIATDYVRHHDPACLFSQLEEDGLFGAVTFDIDGQVVSRDLLDSILELNFLHTHLGVLDGRPRTILDIGAGYGRLAHRLATVAPHVTYLCTDAVPTSTFLCEYYTGFRDLPNVEVIPLHELDTALEGRQVDLALNVHSFSEMPYGAIEFWLGLVARLEIPDLFTVPNVENTLISREDAHEANTGRDVEPLLAELGYEFTVRQPKYADSPIAQTYGVFPAWHWLLRRSTI